MVLLAAVAVVAAFAFVAGGRSRLYRYAGGVALAGHLFVAVVLLPSVSYDWDVAAFHEAALRVLAGGGTAPFSAVGSFAAAQALVYAVFGADPTTLAVVNGLLAVLFPLPLCSLARRLYPSLETARALVLVALFLPLPFLFSSLPMRDALSTLLALGVLALVARALDRDAPEGLRWGAAAAALPLGGALFLLREELALLALLGALGAASVRALRRATGRRVTLASLLPVGAPVGAVGFALFAQFFPVDALDARVRYRATGGAAYLEFVRYDSWADVVLAAPIRAIYFQFAPFPLHVDSAFDLAAGLSLPVVVALAVVAYRSLRHLKTDPAVEVLLVVFYLGGVVGYGLVDANFGTTVRHRTPFVLLLGALGAPALESWYRTLARSLRRRVGDRHEHGRDDGEQRHEAEELDGGA